MISASESSTSHRGSARFTPTCASRRSACRSSSVKNGAVDALADEERQGFGVRVLVDGAWGFASSARARAGRDGAGPRLAVDIARASALARAHAGQARAARALERQLPHADRARPVRRVAGGEARLLFRADAAMRARARHRRGRRLAGVPARRRRRSPAPRAPTSSRSSSRPAAASWRTAVGERRGAEALLPEQLRPPPGHRAAASWSRRWTWPATPRASPRRPLRCSAPRSARARSTTVIIDRHPDGAAGPRVLRPRRSSWTGCSAWKPRTPGPASSRPTSAAHSATAPTQVNIVADATVPGGLGTFGWDDEGVPAQRTPIVRERPLRQLPHVPRDGGRDSASRATARCAPTAGTASR